MVIKSAVIGCGNAGHVHSTVLSAHPDAELTAVCDVDESKVEDITSEFNATGYTNYEELLSTERIDSVHICTPVQSHAQLATKTLSQEIPVLIEKPAATSTDEVDQIMEASRENDVMASVVHNRLYTSQVQEALARVEKGEIGDIVSVTMLVSGKEDLSGAGGHLGARGDWVFQLPGGELGESMPHHTYLPLRFVDSVAEVIGVGKQNFANYEDQIDMDGVSVVAKDTADRLVTIKVLTNSTKLYQLYLHGTEGELQVDLRRLAGTYKNSNTDFGPKDVVSNILNFEAQLAVNILKQAKKVIERKLDDSNSDIYLSYNHYLQISDYLGSLENETEPPVTLNQARDTIRILEAISKSEVSDDVRPPNKM